MTVQQPENTAWYVVETAPQAEKRVVDHLGEAKVVAAYLPLETRMRRLGRRRGRFASPLLPRYVFVQLTHDARGTPEGLHLIRALDGVIGLIGVNGVPQSIPTRWLELLQQAEALGAFDYCSRGRPNYAANDKVRVIDGPFADWIGEFICTTKDGRIKILMQALDGSRSTRVKVPAGLVEPVNPEPVASIWPPSGQDAA